MVADNLKSLRKAEGWNQEVFAHIARLDRSYVGAVENGKHNCTLGTLQAIADAFRVEIRDLLTPGFRKSDSATK